MIWSIGDLHFDITKNKSMDIFGENWKDHEEKIIDFWKENVCEDDLVIVAGDISWALKLEESMEDLMRIDNLPGVKCFIKGNHDYWWSTAAKFNKFCVENGFSNQFILNNNFYEYGDYAICGTRGWFFEEQRSGEHDEKVFKRELMRLEASLKAAGDRHKIVFLHYPPKYKGYECPEIIELMKRYGVRQCFYGHLHGASHGLAMEGQWDGIEYHLLSADKLGFRPFMVIS